MSETHPPENAPEDSRETREDTRAVPANFALPALPIVGRYRLEREIGQGGFGRVYLGFDPELDRAVAIKELRARRGAMEEEKYAAYLARFRREARAAGTIHHPNVVTAYDLHTDGEGNSYLVMEYVDGTPLDRLLRQEEPVPTERAFAIAVDVARALEAVHERGIVHRDIKPANILITRRGAAKLTDFGVALVPTEPPLTVAGGGHPGTPAYMSPEQLPPYRVIDERSDLYALGLVLYDMLVERPFRARRARTPLAELRPDLPPRLIAAVQRLLAAEPEDRYASGAALIRDLEHGDEATHRAPPTPRWRGRPWLPVAAAALVIAIAVPAMLFATRSGSTPQTGPTAQAAASGTAPPAPAATSAAPSSAAQQPVTLAATAAPAGSAVASQPLPSPAAPATASWTEPRGLLILRYPAAWQQQPPPLSPPTVLFVRGPDNAQFTVGITDPQQGSVAEEIAAIRQAQASDAANVYTEVRVADALIAGEPAQALAFTVAARSNPAAQRQCVWWIANHEGKEFGFLGYDIGAHREEIDRIVGSIILTNGWTDSAGRVRLSHPSGWTVTRDERITDNVLELDGPDGVIFFLTISDPAFGTVESEILADINGQKNDGRFIFDQGPVADIRIGTEVGKTFSYTVVSRTNTKVPASAGAVWEVNRNGAQFEFVAGNIGAHRAEVDAIIASVTFLR